MIKAGVIVLSAMDKYLAHQRRMLTKGAGNDGGLDELGPAADVCVDP
jgi:hypothetical protein